MEVRTLIGMIRSYVYSWAESKAKSIASVINKKFNSCLYVFERFARVEVVRAGVSTNRRQAGSRSRKSSRLSQAEAIYPAALSSAVNTLQPVSHFSPVL